MKKTILTLILAAFTVCGFSQKTFYTVDAQPVVSSIKTYDRIVADTVVTDSSSITYNCWFGQTGNPYVDTLTHNWCGFNQVPYTIKGNASTSYYINVAWKACDAYRKKNYPDVK